MIMSRVLCQEWLDKAREDELVAEELLKSKRFPAATCFHFQQMIEKNLKALLIFLQKEPPKTHDLIILGNLIEQLMPDIKNYKSELELLSPYYIESRYPDFPEITLDNSSQAYESALRIKQFVLEGIK